jgi:cytochrome c
LSEKADGAARVHNARVIARSLRHQRRIIMKSYFLVAIGLLLAFEAQTLAANGNPAQGQRVFGTCAACHSLQPEQNMTGPSLADLWGRKAGDLPTFNRYSPALTSSNIFWNDKTPNDWIEDPQRLVPGNQMQLGVCLSAARQGGTILELRSSSY